jgi:hypothetical protein
MTTPMQHDLFGAPPVPHIPQPGTCQPGTLNLSTSGELVQVAPGRWACKGGPAPECVLAEVVRHADGTLGLRPGGYGRLAKFDADLGRLIGFEGQLHTVRRLARAGFITLYRPSPCVTFLDLDSWARHMEETEADPDFWDAEGPNLKRYLMANGLRVI